QICQELNFDKKGHPGVKHPDPFSGMLNPHKILYRVLPGRGRILLFLPAEVHPSECKFPNLTYYPYLQGKIHIAVPRGLAPQVLCQCDLTPCKSPIFTTDNPTNTII